ncbi:hypothetical protein AB0K21_33510 [Streptosporangium sp. NPDC049248]|uniref:hypothetical protein n=1 Tax=Streptosporangium sp. NPDC049248 TaxID=3155651 RepID=UPI00343AFED1
MRTAPREYTGILHDLAVRPDGVVWAIGEDTGTAWMGRFEADGWRQVELPSVKGLGLATTIDARGNVWAFIGSPDHGSELDHSYAARWDGKAWQVTDLGPGLFVQDAVTVGEEIWFLAKHGPYDPESPAVVKRLTGGIWVDTKVPIPAEGLDGQAPGEVWAVGRGRERVDTGPEDRQPTAARWNGHRWETVPLPPLEQLPQDGRAIFWDVLVRGHGQVWAAGGIFGSSGEEQPGSRALLARWDGRTWRIEVEADGVLEGAGFMEIEADGRGGAWLRDSHDTYLRHLDATGRTIQRQRLDGGQNCSQNITAIARKPETTMLWGAGAYADCSGGVYRAALYQVD